MQRFTVRTNCEYSIEIEAESEEEALAQAEKLDVDTWEQAWAPMEVEEEE